MTKRHFEAFARAIKADLDASKGGAFETEQRNKCEYAAIMFANVAQQTNDRFDRYRFLQACGLR